MARVLVVDDEIGIRELLQEILQDHLHEVKTAATAAEASDLLFSFSPHVVLLDVWLKHSNGLDLLKEWFDKNLVTMPVVLMSGHANVETWNAASKMGAYCLIEKPVSIKVLINTLKPAVAIAMRQKPASDHARLYATTPFIPPVAPTLEQIVSSAEPDQEQEIHPAFEMPFRAAREEFEKAYFSHHIHAHQGSMTAISDATGVERTHLYRVLKTLNLNGLQNQQRSGKPRPGRAPIATVRMPISKRS